MLLFVLGILIIILILIKCYGKKISHEKKNNEIIIRLYHAQNKLIHKIALSTQGHSAFHIRFLINNKLLKKKGYNEINNNQLDTLFVQSNLNNSSFTSLKDSTGKTIGIKSHFGSIKLTQDDILNFYNQREQLITQITNLNSSLNKMYSQIKKIDIGLLNPLPKPKNNISQIDEHLITAISFSNKTNTLYGGGSSSWQNSNLLKSQVSAYIGNGLTYVPYYYSADGYSILGVVNTTTGLKKYAANIHYPISYKANADNITWLHTLPFEYFFMPADSLDKGTQSYYQLIGSPKVPPKYTFGFMASKWGWDTKKYIDTTLAKFRKDKYPIDVFIMDFSWFTTINDYAFSSSGEPSYKDFSFSKYTFPDPISQIKKYHKDNFYMGAIRKPRLGNTELLEFAQAKKWILPGGTANLNNTIYAIYRNLNFSLSAVRNWYTEQLKHYIEAKVNFFWNDEGETDYFTNYWWNIAQINAFKKYPNTRFFSLNRTWTPGMASLGASSWTGDISGNWKDLQKVPGMVLNWGLAGMPYVACDLGGFNPPEHSSPELLIRWYQIGVFMPLMRVHSIKTIKPHFPWIWGNQFGQIFREILNLRYRLLPYHYSLAHNMYKHQQLWIRPLIAQYPKDSNCQNITDQWLDGRILVAPILTKEPFRNIYLPADDWYEFNKVGHIRQQKLTYNADIHNIPLFIPSGSILTLGPIIQSTNEMPGGSLEVHIYGGKNCKFTLVEDDGTNAYLENKNVRNIIFAWNDNTKELTWKIIVYNTITKYLCYENMNVIYFTNSYKKQINNIDINKNDKLSFL